MDDLSNPAGVLHPILTRVKKDHTLMLAIRENFINIYYRGGNILKIEEQYKGSYKTSFDRNYNKSGLLIPDSPKKIANPDDSQRWIDSFASRKIIMDEHLTTNRKAEREFQQLVARENNNSKISKESEYFVTDIEVRDNEVSDIEATECYPRFDMMAIRWLAAQRKNSRNCKAALIEMKYGDDALGDPSGLLAHLKDMKNLVSNKDRYAKLLETTESQFNQLDELELLNYEKSKSHTKVKLNVDEKPEVIFILANHNPRRSELRTILSDPEIDQYAQSQLFDLKFYVASFAGYGLHSTCMLPLDKFRKLL